MKTVTDAVEQENGVWGVDNNYNRMAWLRGSINYAWLDESTRLLYSKEDRDCQLDEEWQIVCTKEEFEAEAKRLHYPNTIPKQEIGICTEGSQCTDGEYCNDCPNKPEPQVHYCRSLSGHVCADGADCRECIAPQHDPVTNPAHYTSGSIECIDAIREALTPEEFRGFCKGNVIKYSWRERAKGGDEDLKKAAWYASRAVDNG